MSTPITARSAAALTIALTLPGLAQAQSSTELGLYGFLTAVEGQQSIGELESDIDLSISDVLDSLDFAAMGFVHHRIDRWSLFADIFYANLGAESENNGIETDLDYRQTILGLYAGYNVYNNVERDGIIDLTAGFRYNKIELAIDAEATLEDGTTTSRSASGDQEWTDVVFGVRASQSLGNGWGISGWADVGLGIDENSTSYQLVVMGNYTFDNNVKLFGGYRFYHIDLEEGDFELNTDTSGPVLGVSYTF